MFLKVNNKISACHDIAEILLKLTLNTNQSMFLRTQSLPSFFHKLARKSNLEIF